MRYRLRTLLIVLALGPPTLAWWGSPVLEWLRSPTVDQPQAQVQWIPPEPGIFIPMSAAAAAQLDGEPHMDGFNPSDWIP